MSEEKKPEKNREEVLEYLQHCVSENLNHARHVENERLTFTSIYIAMVIGAVAVVFGLENNYVAAIVSALLTVFGYMAAQLNGRWQGVFDDHMKKAAQYDDRWYKMIGEGRSGYIFGNYSPGRDQKLHEGRTRKIFRTLYWLIFMALLMLTGYLIWKACKSPIGEGFYFTDEAITDLKNLLTHVLEEANK